MNTSKVVVLGSNGHFGHTATVAFRDAGWSVTGFGRTNRRPVTGTQFVAGDGNDVAVVREAIKEADVVVYGLHLPYDKWDNGRAEAQLQVVIDAIGVSGKTLMFPGTLYNYRASDRTIDPSLRQSGEKRHGEIRIRLEAMLKAAADYGYIQAIIIRGGDYFGPGERNDQFEQALLMHANKGKVYMMGPETTRHTWAYLPDFGRAFSKVAEARTTLAAFENFHFAGHFVSHGQMAKAIGKGLPQTTQPAAFPWWMVRALGFVSPVMRAVHSMNYGWMHEMELVDARLDGLLGEGFTTPFEEAVATTVASLVDARKAAA
jgi:nucleoside-diphosphate-sugar epimerase